MAQRGGARPGAGRKPGSPRKLATQEQKAALSERAQAYSDVALKSLAEIATKGTSEAARVSAATALLDRGYGRPRQEVTGANGGPLAEISLAHLTNEELTALAALLEKAKGNPDHTSH